MTTLLLERPSAVLKRITWRPLRGRADYRMLAKIGQRANLADGVDDVVTPDTVANELDHPVNFDPARDVLIAELEGRPVAWQITQWRLDGDQRYLYLLRGFVAPGWRRRGLGRALLRRGEARLRQVAANHPAGAERYYSTFTPERRAGKVALFASEGYGPVRHFYTMVCRDLDHLPEAPLPAGLELRPARPQDWRTIWEANEEAFRDHWSPVVLTDEDYQRWLGEADFDPRLWQVAWDTANNQVAGVAFNLIPSAANAVHQRQRGLLAELSVRRPWRHHGLGRALIVSSLRALRGRGQAEVTLGVDTQNLSGALRLYESVGFQPIDHGMILIKPLEGKP